MRAFQAFYRGSTIPAENLKTAPATEQVATLISFYHRRLDHYVSLVAKYRRAARQPWLPISADPPLPEIPPEFVVQ